MTKALVAYEEWRAKLAETTSIVEAKSIGAKAEALRTHALRVHDPEMARRMGEIYLWAQHRMGELCASLETRPGMKPVITGDLRFKAEALRQANLSHGQATRCETLAQIERPEYGKQLSEPMLPTIAQLVLWVRRRKAESTENPTCTVQDLQELIDSGRQFGTLYADPPWPYENQGTRSATDEHYDTPTMEWISALPVEKLSAPDAHLHLWTTTGFIREALALVESWGFAYKSMLIWVKPEMGIGNYWRVSHEILLLGVRGRCTFLDKGQSSWLQCSRGAHSEKPEEIRHRIEKVSPGPRLEMFARRGAPNWTSWGNEIERDLFYGPPE